MLNDSIEMAKHGRINVNFRVKLIIRYKLIVSSNQTSMEAILIIAYL